MNFLYLFLLFDSSDHQYKGVAFNTNGAPPNVIDNRLVSVGLR